LDAIKVDGQETTSLRNKILEKDSVGHGDDRRLRPPESGSTNE
jgi:hypothetical protein